MNMAIRDIGTLRPDDLYALFSDIYSSSNGMSETLEGDYFQKCHGCWRY